MRDTPDKAAMTQYQHERFLFRRIGSSKFCCRIDAKPQLDPVGEYHEAVYFAPSPAAAADCFEIMRQFFHLGRKFLAETPLALTVDIWRKPPISPYPSPGVARIASINATPCVSGLNSFGSGHTKPNPEQLPLTAEAPPSFPHSLET
jgi:hypothetical protein